MPKPRMSLATLALRYHCDKLTRHSYISFYENLFADMEIGNMLEIGIGYKELMEPFAPGYVDGASIYMWRDYLPNTNIWACDIRGDILINDGRIHSFVCDQSKVEELQKLVERIGVKLDVIIDDGSHQLVDQILSARTLLPHLNLGGVYVIEDVQRVDELVGAIGGVPYCFGKTSDDNLVVIRR